MARRVYIWDNEQKRLVELNPDWRATPHKQCTATEELIYGGMRATDGTPIDTKKKHREYLKRGASPQEASRGELAMCSDFTQHWEKKQTERDAYRGADGKTRRHPEREAIREAIGKAYHKLYRE